MMKGFFVSATAALAAVVGVKASTPSSSSTTISQHSHSNTYTTPISTHVPWYPTTLGSLQKVTHTATVNKGDIINAVSFPHTYSDLSELAEITSSGLSCKQSKTNEAGVAGKCNNGQIFMWKSEDCSKNCRCDGKGLYCPAPKGCALTGALDSPTRFCAGNADFSCACSGKVARDTPPVNSRKLRFTRNDKLMCSGDVEKKDIAATCMDGNFLMWNAATCSNHCKCTESGITCEHPSDCGPTEEISKFCSTNQKFQCSCHTPKVEPPATTEIGAREPNLETQDVDCRGKDMLKTLWASYACLNKKDIGIYLNGYYCQAHCSCAGSGVVCSSGGSPSGIDQCGNGDEIARVFCTSVRPEFTCSC